MYAYGGAGSSASAGGGSGSTSTVPHPLDSASSYSSVAHIHPHLPMPHSPAASAASSSGGSGGDRCRDHRAPSESSIRFSASSLSPTTARPCTATPRPEADRCLPSDRAVRIPTEAKGAATARCRTR
ncbi:hypothetical protein DAPPUDRAFT_270562 [Daphnia pulex]|uniref:Uncharacterized protein n=1 Tax=Daphnia pulex TaxID=6669 RepID=E9I0X7_DAPPU|nr:hypothetical protein DAPPUDRAFT_270562 [Daphnia pulex]|eukprot:EFX62353.1 hypothetical protein DAPPUDRAFT_270562 [Daphnia pulex]